MISIDNWIPFLKIDEDGYRCMSQQTYEPLLNPERTIFCANHDWNNKYQRQEDPIRKLYTHGVVDWFFENEVVNLLKYKDKPYAPSIIDIDQKLKRIYFKWQGETCNEIIYSGRNLDNYCSDWKDQIKRIMIDLYREGTYKLTMYPHCHFIEDGQMKTIDWYGCVPVKDPYINSEYMDGIIHATAKFRLEETGAVVNNKYNLEIMFQRSIQEHVKWGKQSMNYIYEEMMRA